MRPQIFGAFKLCFNQLCSAEGVMIHDTGQPDGQQVQRRQHQKQRQQQQQQQQEHPYVAPGSALPEKEHQSKHKPISESAQFDSHSCDQ
jgi:transcription initiation factor TFIID subunit TAF12